MGIWSQQKAKQLIQLIFPSVLWPRGSTKHALIRTVIRACSWTLPFFCFRLHSYPHSQCFPQWSICKIWAELEHLLPCFLCLSDKPFIKCDNHNWGVAAWNLLEKVRLSPGWDLCISFSPCLVCLCGLHLRQNSSSSKLLRSYMWPPISNLPFSFLPVSHHMQERGFFHFLLFGSVYLTQLAGVLQ